MKGTHFPLALALTAALLANAACADHPSAVTEPDTPALLDGSPAIGSGGKSDTTTNDTTNSDTTTGG